MTLEEAADRVAIRELIDAYARCAGRRDADGQMALFTADTHFVVYMDARSSEPRMELHSRAELSAPVGLNLGASSPQETALSIVAEVVAVRPRAPERPATYTRRTHTRRAVMNSSFLHRADTQETSPPPTRVHPREPLAEFGSPRTLIMEATGVPTRMRDPVCPVCSRPIKNGAAAIEVAGLRLHLRCAASRRRSSRR